MVKAWKRGKKGEGGKEEEMCADFQQYSEMQIHVWLLECLFVVSAVCVESRSFNQASNNIYNLAK